MIYKCRNCGANAVYSPEKGTMYCPYCDSQDSEELAPGGGMAVCMNCGGELKPGDYMSAVKCEHCGTYVIFEERTEGCYKPHVILPFKLGKKEVQEKIRARYAKSAFIPADFLSDAKLSEINTRFIERYYQSLLKRRAVINPLNKTSRNEFVSSSTVRDINKLLRNCFEQAVKWELMEKNPCTHATVPKHKSQKRDIWTADTLMYALSVCEDERLKLAINLSFSCSLRLGELLGLTWDCVDISHEAIEENRAYVFINKESQRIRKESLNALDGKDVLLVFPTNHKKNSTVRILKTPKTESSVRKIFLPKSVANMLVDWKAEQDEMKEILGDEYMDYNLVMASTFGLPLGDGAIRGPLKKLIEDYNLPPVVFHSFRHSSVTYKLKLNGGDIKAVQGDSGHAQVNMVTDVYSHILDDDRRKNAELFEEAFYEKKNLDPQMHVQQENNNATVADEVDPELLAKVLANPEMRALLNSLAKTMK